MINDGLLPLPLVAGSGDRFVATYVLDLLTDERIDAALGEAHRVLRPGGMLCVAGLTRGRGGATRMVSYLWTLVHRLRPQWVGGCRPVEVAPRLEPDRWRSRRRQRVVAWGITSEIVVAEASEGARPSAA